MTNQEPKATNPDNVGGLPTPEFRVYRLLMLATLEARGKCDERVEDDILEIMDKLWLTMYESERDHFRELCRAAPAGGDVLKNEQYCPCMQESCPICYKPVSAPAGSGEVSMTLIDVLGQQHQCDEDGTMCIVSRQAVDEAIALLRKLQQGADYLMVPRQLSEAMHLAYWNADNIHGDKVVITDITDGDRIILQRTWEEMIAASQGQEGGTNG